MIGAYYAALAASKRALFALYDGEQLKRKFLQARHREVATECWTWGHQFRYEGESACGSSIGEDEIKLFLEIGDLIDMRSSATIGVAFGLSLFALAIGRPSATAIGIDDYSDHRGEGTNYVRAFVERTIADKVPNARLQIGSSPDDTAAAVGTHAPLGLAFIDGEHTDRAAKGDFEGLSPHLDARSVVLWHDTPQVLGAFKSCADARWDQRVILRTYRRMGLYYNAVEHPALHAYLALCALPIRVVK